MATAGLYICDVCLADELLFVSVGNRFATKHLHVSINLTCKYQLTYHCLLITLA